MTVKVALLYSGAYGLKVLRHLRDEPGFCTGCEVCTSCRADHDLDFSSSLAFIWQQPERLPSMIEDPERYLPADANLAGVHTVLAINLHQDLLLALVDQAARAGAKALIAPVEDPAWVRPGVANQAARRARELGIEAAFPKPFCALGEDAATPAINQFLRHFRIGYPEVRVTTRGGRIEKVEVKRSSPCGCAYFMARNLEGKPIDEHLVEVLAQAWHGYPCIASMAMDPQLKDTILHRGGYIHRDAVLKGMPEGTREKR